MENNDRQTENLSINESEIDWLNISNVIANYLFNISKELML